MSEQLFIDYAGTYLAMDCNLYHRKHGREEFIHFMARRMAEKRNGKIGVNFLDYKESKYNFEDFLRQSGVDFGNEGYDWSINGAFEIADEYASYDDLE